MAGFSAEVVDVKGAFLKAEFDSNHRMCVNVPKGFEHHYPGNVVLLLNDILSTWSRQAVAQTKSRLRKHFSLDEQGEFVEYIGCKIERSLKDRWMKLTQPVLIQSFSDEFDLPEEKPVLPAKAGEVMSSEDGTPTDDHTRTTYRSGVGKIPHMMKWSRHDILNPESYLVLCPFLQECMLTGFIG
jgi:hypothetical protein